MLSAFLEKLADLSELSLLLTLTSQNDHFLNDLYWSQTYLYIFRFVYSLYRVLCYKRISLYISTSCIFSTPPCSYLSLHASLPSVPSVSFDRCTLTFCYIYIDNFICLYEYRSYILKKTHICPSEMDLICLIWLSVVIAASVDTMTLFSVALHLSFERGSSEKPEHVCCLGCLASQPVNPAVYPYSAFRARVTDV